MLKLLGKVETVIMLALNAETGWNEHVKAGVIRVLEEVKEARKMMEAEAKSIAGANLSIAPGEWPGPGDPNPIVFRTPIPPIAHQEEDHG